MYYFFFSSRRRHTRFDCDWSSDVCSSDLAGGKFDKNTYKVSGGLHGVAVSVVNALSEYLEVHIKRDGRQYYQRYERGVKASELKDLGKAEGTGTTVAFKPDPQIFTELEFNYDVLSNRLRELA